jgi:hypothetical protein
LNAFLVGAAALRRNVDVGLVLFRNTAADA